MRYRIRSALITITAGVLLGSGAALAASNACKADLTADGVVNFADLAVLKSVFFQSCKDPGPTCGDGVAQGPTEQCDDGNLLSDDGCSKSCTIEGPLPLVCGDWISVEPEQCDDGNLVNGDGCSATCTIERPIVAVCGDGFADRPEQCDDHNLANGDGCSATCQIEVPVAISRFEDLGLTVLDHQTGLEWEKKTADGSIHDKNNDYTWSTGTNNPDGTAFTVFLAALNAGMWLGTEDRPACFAGHCDWRLPSVSELKSIVDCSHGAPCVAPIFGPTKWFSYWSSLSLAFDPSAAWDVHFFDGNVYADFKRNSYNVRAVRGGL
jgi:cysteine-rich repeat protein